MQEYGISCTLKETFQATSHTKIDFKPEFLRFVVFFVDVYINTDGAKNSYLKRFFSLHSRRW
jgi:hypothetical protein